MKHQNEDSLNHAKRHEVKKDLVLIPRVRLCCRLQYKVKLYCCDTPFSDCPHEGLDTQPLHIKNMYGQVYATTARQIRNVYII